MTSVRTESFLTPEGRFCWPFLDRPRTEDINGKKLDEPKYEVNIYFPKTSRDPAQCRTYQLLAGRVMEVVRQAFRGEWPMRNWENWPIEDCDADAAKLEKYPWGAGCWKIRANAGRYRPAVVDAGNNLMAVDVTGAFRDFKGGDYGYASVNCLSFDNVTKGVMFGLEAVKKTRDGDPIGGGGRPVEAIFGAPSGAPAGGGFGPQGAPPPPGGVYGGAPPQQPGFQQGPSYPPQQPYASPPQQPYAPPQQPYAPPQQPGFQQGPGYPPQQPYAPAQADPAPYPNGARAPTGAGGPATGYAASYPSDQRQPAPGYGPAGGMPPPPPIGTR